MYCFKLVKLHSPRLNKIEWILKSGLINKDVWLAGGSLRTLIDPKEKICDYDLFFKRQEKDIEGSKYNKVPEVRQKLNNLGFKCTFECPEGKLYTYQKEIINMLTEDMESTFIKVQLICEYFYQTPEELLSTFDLSPCLFATDGKFLWTYKYAVRDVKRKVARCHKLTYPVASVKRLIKYSNKGYNVNLAIQDIVSNLIEHRDILASDSMRVYID